MASLLNYIRLLLLSISSMFLLCTTFAADATIANGMVMGKVCWFHFVMLFFAGSVLLTAFTMPAPKFSFSVADILVLIMAGIVAGTYDWSLNPEPEKMIFCGQLVMLWYMLRYVMTVYPSLRLFFLSLLICTGFLEAIWGMGQLHGLSGSNHTLFRLTGTFFNPGPFSGYVAIILPLAFGFVLRFKNCRKTAWWQTWTSLYYFAWLSLLVMLIVLPAGMSRTAWIAAAVSCAWVYWGKRIGWRRTKEFINRHYVIATVSAVAAIFILSGAMAGIYLMKKDSANGRLLMWNLTAEVIRQNPVSGKGLGGFPAAYADVQGDYFASGKASETEKLVAGCPEYAFNEYLQIGAEEGIFGLLVFVGWLGVLFYQGMKNRVYGTSGSILALAIFALASYPLQLPSFWIILVFLGVVCVSGNKKKIKTPPTPTPKGMRFAWFIAIAIMASGSAGLFMLQKGSYTAYKKWNTIKMLYASKAYESALDGYKELHDTLRHKPKFLFEQAMCLNKTEKYQQAEELFQQATRLSADPMIHYVRARNKQDMGNYEDAEKILLRAIDILPERIYPYYLLAKLYTVPEFYQEDKFKMAADAVLTKEPKVQSTAIREMRTEIEKIVKSLSISPMEHENREDKVEKHTNKS